jgi:prepilin-type N-terminal cleavage/methylation domain-containing protein
MRISTAVPRKETMHVRLQRLAQEESAFTLIELLIVVIILSILMTIALPSYISFRLRAADSAAKQNIHAAVPVAEAYVLDSTQGYTGMTLSALQSYDAGIKNITVANVTSTSFCLQSTVNNRTWRKASPTADTLYGTC